MEPYLAATAPPQVQELRWSNGKLPKSFDPARAAASPESDVVSALFEGLTEIDPQTLEAVPAGAEKWSVSEDGKNWTFHLRKNARWSNGDRVTAADLVASWKRAATITPKPAHPELFENIVGLIPKSSDKPAPPEPPKTQPAEPQASGPLSSDLPLLAEDEEPAPRAPIVGVTAVDDVTLRVSLVKPDADLPKLVADPAFRPVYAGGKGLDASPLDTAVVTNGPFTVAEVTNTGVAIERSETYWNKAAIKLERIRFVPTETAEAALEAYKRGELDAITNSDFEPLALKLLAPYGDLRQTPHNALNLYEFNTRVAPFSDRRVREALSAAIDRERLVDSEFQGTAEAADDFLPISKKGDGSIDHDPAYARDLLTRSGYPNGENFPVIRLVINRNDAQQRVARLIARMWKQNLNVDTEVITKDAAGLDATRSSGEYDIIRRGVVLPTADESVTLAAIFHAGPVNEPVDGILSAADPNATLAARPEFQTSGHATPSAAERPAATIAPGQLVASASDALYQLYSIPLYSPNAYSLVKPYVRGLQITGLNGISVRNISIDNNWSAPRAGNQ